MTHGLVHQKTTGARGAAQKGRWRRTRPAVLATASVLALGVSGVLPGPVASAQPAHQRDDHARRPFVQRNLVSDIRGRAQLTDRELKNPWGIAFGPTTPAWVTNQFNPRSACPENNPDCIPAPRDLLTKITLYQGANGQSPISKVDLEVRASSPTGIVFNPTSTFRIDQGDGPVPARFMFNETFVNKAGTAPVGRITGWAPTTPFKTRTTRTGAQKNPALHFGLALVPGKAEQRRARLLAADGLNNTVDVFNARFDRLRKGHLFVDRRAEAQGMSPYNVGFLEGKVYVSYVGKKRGAVSVFRPNGRFQERLVTSRRLQGPWGMAIAPRRWGGFGHSLLVGNVDDGRINAFGLKTGHFRGTLRARNGDPLVNPGLWGIAFGNGVIGTPRTLLFVAGVGEEVGGLGQEIYEHGLMGAIRPAKRR